MSAKSTGFDEFAALVSVSAFLSGPCILLWQIYGYLRFEKWHPLSIIDALHYCGFGWAAFPTDWMGLYRILEWMPISLALPLIGGIFILLISANN